MVANMYVMWCVNVCANLGEHVRPGRPNTRVVPRLSIVLIYGDEDDSFENDTST